MDRIVREQVSEHLKTALAFAQSDTSAYLAPQHIHKALAVLKENTVVHYWNADDRTEGLCGLEHAPCGEHVSRAVAKLWVDVTCDGCKERKRELIREKANKTFEEGKIGEKFEIPEEVNPELTGRYAESMALAAENIRITGDIQQQNKRLKRTSQRNKDLREALRTYLEADRMAGMSGGGIYSESVRKGIEKKLL